MRGVNVVGFQQTPSLAPPHPRRAFGRPVRLEQAQTGLDVHEHMTALRQLRLQRRHEVGAAHAGVDDLRLVEL